jgi:DNA replication protein DnaC
MNIDELEVRRIELRDEIKQKEDSDASSAELQELEDKLLVVEDHIARFTRMAIECGIGKRFMNATIEDFKSSPVTAYIFENASLDANNKVKDAEAKDDSGIEKKKIDFHSVMTKYAEDFIRHLSQGTSFILVGPHGSGKTHAAHALAFACANKYLTARRDLLDFYVVRMSDLMAMFTKRNELGDETVHNLRKRQLLIVDEVGSEKHSDSGWTIEQFVGRVLRYRYDNCLPTIITSNASATEFVKTYGSRAETVLLGKSFRTILLFTEKDIRKED